MFDPRDLIRDHARSPGGDDPRENARREKMREGHRREYTPSRNRESFERRTARALAEVGMYRSVSFRDLAEAHFDGHPYTARRAVDRMVKGGLMREHKAIGPKGGTYKVLTLTQAGASPRPAMRPGAGPGQRSTNTCRTRQARRALTRHRHLPGGADRTGETHQAGSRPEPGPY